MNFKNLHINTTAGKRQSVTIRLSVKRDFTGTLIVLTLKQAAATPG